MDSMGLFYGGTYNNGDLGYSSRENLLVQINSKESYIVLNVCQCLTASRKLFQSLMIPWRYT